MIVKIGNVELTENEAVGKYNAKELIKLAADTFCKGGTVDSNGIFRTVSGSDEIYLANDKTGGWGFRITKVRSNGYHDFVKWSIKSDGTMKNKGKYIKSDSADFINIYNKSTKYAIVPAETINFNLVWKYL